MDPVAAVLAGHMIGDWIFQTDWQAANKTTSWRANQAHMFWYHLPLGFFCLLAMSVPATLIVLAVSWVTHSFIDRRWPVKWLMRKTGSEPFSCTDFGVIATDQALHLSILLTMAGLVAG